MGINAWAEGGACERRVKDNDKFKQIKPPLAKVGSGHQPRATAQFRLDAPCIAPAQSHPAAASFGPFGSQGN